MLRWTSTILGLLALAVPVASSWSHPTDEPKPPATQEEIQKVFPGAVYSPETGNYELRLTPEQMKAFLEQTPSAEPVILAGPPGKLAAESIEFDAGRVVRGEKIRHEFAIRSIGENPLLLEAKPSCGCTVLDFDKSIAPGATGKVTAVLDTKTFKGPISKSVIVDTNDPERVRINLLIKADVYEPMDVSPSALVSFAGRYDAATPREVTLSADDGAPFDVTDVKLGHDAFRVKVAPADPAATTAPKEGVVAGGASRYVVTVSPVRELPVGKLDEILSIATTHPKAPAIELRIVGSVTGDISVAPSAAVLKGFAAADPVGRSARILIQKRAGEPLALGRATTSLSGVSLAQREAEPGRSFEITASYEGPDVTQTISGTMLIETNDIRQPVLEVPVWIGAATSAMAAAPGAPPAPAAAPR